MQRFDNILFVFDASPNADIAFSRAVELAVTNAARLTVIGVSDPIPRTMHNLQEAFIQAHEERLASLVKRHGNAGLDIKTRVLLGNAAYEIIKEVIRGNYKLLIKPAEGKGGISNKLFGTYDLNLLRKCPCPVWIIKSTKKKKYLRILAAIDPSPAEKSNAELNTLILDLATSLAQQENCRLHIVHAWAMAGESTLRSGHIKMPTQEINRLVRETRKSHKQWLDDLMAAYDLSTMNTQIHLLKGPPEEVIPGFARKHRVDLIVMGTVARTGIPGFFIGNTAEKTLAKVDCSVLAVKPQSFVSPIKA